MCVHVLDTTYVCAVRIADVGERTAASLSTLNLRELTTASTNHIASASLVDFTRRMLSHGM